MPASTRFERFRQHRSEKRLARVLLKATRLLRDTIRRNIVGADAGSDTHARLAAEIVELRARLEAERQTNAILQARLDRIRPRQRPHYNPAARFRILTLMNLLGMSIDDIAHRFRITATTVSRWVGELALNPTPVKIGAAARCDRPLRRYADVVRELTRTPRGSRDWRRPHRADARPRRTQDIVQDRRKDSEGEADPHAGAAEREAPRHRDFPNHVWSMDMTEIPMLFGFSIELAGVIDNFSRMPVMLRLYFNRPTAADMAALLRRATRRFGRPRHLVTDQGGQFTGQTFRNEVARLRIRQRFGAVDKHGSIAIMERFWKTIKNTTSLRSRFTASPRKLERRLTLVVQHYAYFRPHASLAGATPAEVYFETPKPKPEPVELPRAAAGRGTGPLPVRIAFVDRETPSLPYLVRNAA